MCRDTYRKSCTHIPCSANALSTTWTTATHFSSLQLHRYREILSFPGRYWWAIRLLEKDSWNYYIRACLSFFLNFSKVIYCGQRILKIARGRCSRVRFPPISNLTFIVIDVDWTRFPTLTHDRRNKAWCNNFDYDSNPTLTGVISTRLFFNRSLLPSRFFFIHNFAQL